MKNLGFALLVFLTFITNNCANTKTIYKKIQPINLSSLTWEDEEWPNEPFREYLYRCLDYQTNPQELKRRRIVFKMYDSLAANSCQVKCALYDTITMQDLQLLAGKKEKDPYVAELIDRTKTELGKVFLYGLVSAPITNIAVLQQRQSIIKTILKNEDLFSELNSVYTQLAQAENLMLSLWAQDGFLSSTKRHYFTIPYFSSINDRLNRSSLALELRSLLGHQQRAIFWGTGIFAAIVLPVYGLMHLNDGELPAPLQKMAQRLQGSGGKLLAMFSSLSDHKYMVGGTAIAAGITCAMASKDDYEWMRDNGILDLCLQTKMIGVASFLNSITRLAHILEAHPELIEICPTAVQIVEFSRNASEQNKMQQLLEFCESSTLQGESAVCSFHGRVLASYKLVYDLKETIEPLMMALGELDAYCSCARLFKEFEDQRVSFCFVNYKQDVNPRISLRNFWNPFINPDVVITNDIDLQGPNRKNMIITGPNAGGKSTLIKAVPINLILAQSIGMAAAEYVEITPFATIATYLNIVDDIAAGNSLFKAQVLRAQEMVNLVEQTPTSEFSFVALDEMFNGTSANESMAAAYSVVKHIGKFENNISIVATHFPLLTQLEKEAEVFANYKVSVNVDDTGIHYPFKLEKGLSNQHVALDILKQEGYDCTIVNEASEILTSVAG